MARHVRHEHSFRAALSKVAAASRRLRRKRERRARAEYLPELPSFHSPAPRTAPPDPVQIAVLAMESVGRASMRACFTGTEVRVCVPDTATAEILRAALVETARSRATDKLIRIVVG